LIVPRTTKNSSNKDIAALELVERREGNRLQVGTSSLLNRSLSPLRVLTWVLWNMRQVLTLSKGSASRNEGSEATIRLGFLRIFAEFVVEGMDVSRRFLGTLLRAFGVLLSSSFRDLEEYF
jgi:hypothetical protein